MRCAAALGAARLACPVAHACLSCAFFQTISIVYIVTAIVGVEAWYAPFLFNFLYRDLFTAMIIGKKLHVEACLLNSTFLTKPNVFINDNAVLFAVMKAPVGCY